MILYPTHNSDGTCTKEYFYAVRALNYIRATGYSWSIDPEWSPEFLRLWTHHVKKTAWERGLIAVIDGRMLKVVVDYRMKKMMPREDSDASRENK